MALPYHCVKIYFNTILPSMPGYSKWSLSLRFPHQAPECTSHLPYTYYMARVLLILHKYEYRKNKMIQYTGVLFHLILLLVYFAQFAYLAANLTHSILLFWQKGICPCGATKTRRLEPCQCRRAVGSWVVRKKYIALCDLYPSSAFTV